MATIRKRGKDQWQVQVRIQGHKPQSKTFRTRADAERWAKVQESGILLGHAKPNCDVTTPNFGECLKRYRMEVTSTKKGHSQESSILQRLEAQSLAKRLMGSITGPDIASWRDSRLKEVAPATVVRELAVISHVFTVAAKEWGMASQENPVTRIQKPRLPMGRFRRISSREMESLVSATQSPELEAIVRIAVETAMRRSEICSLDWSNIDLDRQLVALSDSKNGESRLIPLSERAKTVLERISNKRDGKVFTLHPDSVSQAFERACKRAKINNLRFHDLRHEATSRFIEKGLSVMEAALITGHKDLRMLLRYTHLRPESIIAKLN
jgi:integrase